MTPFTIQLMFYGDLDFFLKCRSSHTVERRLAERTSVKDVIESCGVPHTEVDLILIDDQPIDFAQVLERDTELQLYPPSWERSAFFADNRLQRRKIDQFAADGHLGKLVRDLRLLGIDVIYNSTADDRHLLDAARNGDRALLTRDRRLLMHTIVRHGYYLRSQNPLEQTHEVLQRFGPTIAPFTRCLRCNAQLELIEKAKIIDRLEPLTKIYYQDFRRCIGCNQIYWPGSHFTKLQARLAQLTKE
jgi:uncharacterized protein with PIN domain